MPNYFTDKWVLEVTGRHRSSVTRWRQKNRFPREVQLLASVQLHGELGHIHRNWNDWRLDTRSGELFSPAGDSFTPNELVALPLRLQELNALRKLANDVRKSNRDPTRPLRSMLLRWLRRAIGRTR